MRIHTMVLCDGLLGFTSLYTIQEQLRRFLSKKEQLRRLFYYILKKMQCLGVCIDISVPTGFMSYNLLFNYYVL